MYNKEEKKLMKKYEICIESYCSNNSDFKEYDNYTFESNNIESAKENDKNVLATWNKESKSIIYNILDLWEV